MKKFLLAFVILLTISLLKVYAQKESYNWMCGDTFGLNFNTPDFYPILIEKPICRDSREWFNGFYHVADPKTHISSTISDSMGNYLFNSYIGVHIWNKNNELIHKYDDIGNDPSHLLDSWLTINGCSNNYIIKEPGNENTYYNFFSRYEKDPDFQEPRYIDKYKPCYHIVDMGQGAGVIKKADVFFTDRGGEVLPIKHANDHVKVPSAIIWATLSAPYFCFTYSMTSSRLS
jgi:hypothetical protein